MNDLIFVTGNMNKVHWVGKFLGRELEHHGLDLDEIQDLDAEKVLRHKAQEAHRILGKPVLVEDTSLVFNALGLLPGTFVKFFIQEIGLEGMCRLLDNFDDRSAYARVIFGLYDGQNFNTFEGKVEGKIAENPRGELGHGWDPIFIRSGQDKTNGEMTEEEYPVLHPRKIAVEKLKEFLK